MKFTDGDIREIKGKTSKRHPGMKCYRGQFYCVSEDGERTSKTKVFWAKKQKDDADEGGSIVEHGAKSLFEEWRASEIKKLVGGVKSSEETAPNTVDAYVNEFISTRTVRTKQNPSGIAQSTLDNYLYSVKHVEAGFRGVELSELTPRLVDRWLKGLAESGKSGSTQKKAYWLLKAACEYAVDNGDLDASAFRACFPKKRKNGTTPKQADPDPNPLDDSSLRLLNVLIDRANEDGEPDAFMVSVEIALLTGMREAEICGLRWKDVDLDGSGQYPTGSIHVCNVLSRAGSGYVEKEPKTKSGDRKIPINDDLHRVLEGRRNVMLAELAEYGVKPSAIEDCYVTGTVSHDWYNPTVLSRRWRGFADGVALKGTKGRRAVFHDLRHTFATKAIHAGIDVETVSKILGHKDVSITLNIYADAMPEAKTRAMAAMNGILRTHPNTGDVAEYVKNGTDE